MREKNRGRWEKGTNTRRWRDRLREIDARERDRNAER